MSDEKSILNDKGGIDWASGPSCIGLRCPFGAGTSVTLYVAWADVPEWWPCTCGAEHAKPPQTARS
jgi:hypothetical protein